MTEADRKIAEVLARFGEPVAGNIWRVQGTAVIYHKALERIAAGAKISFDPPQILRAERDEAVLLVTGRMGDRFEWSIGEALVNVNYRVSGRQAAYVYAMAEKRAKDRVILKLVELHGLVYSEEEADEFRHARPGTEASNEDAGDELAASEPAESADPSLGSDDPVGEELRRRIDRARTINAVTDLMLDAATQRSLAALPDGLRDRLRDHAKARLVALGWPARKAA